MIDAFLEYLSKNDELIEYLMIDYLVEIARRKFPYATKAIEGHVNNGRYRKLSQSMKKGIPTVDFERIIPKDTVFNNVSWKNKYPAKTPDGKEALYSAFLKIPEADIEYLKECR